MSSEQTETGRRLELSTPSEREIVTTRVFDAPRERVIDAFTKPELIAQWWGQSFNTTIVDALDLRPGGAWRFVERKDDGSEHCFRGVYREIALPERLVYTFEWEGAPGHVLVDTVTFEKLEASTKVTIHSLFHTGSERDAMLGAGMEWGLNESYRSLDALLASIGNAQPA